MIFGVLAIAEVAVVVRWGSSALARAAEVVLEGTGPDAVPGFLRSLCLQPALPATRARYDVKGDPGA